jgi:hypothetical protein
VEYANAAVHEAARERSRAGVAAYVQAGVLTRQRDGWDDATALLVRRVA